MDHDKIKKHLDRLAERIAEQDDHLDNQSYDFIRDLRTECDNQATKIVDLEEKAEAVPEALEEWRAARQDVFDNTSKISAENDARWERLSNAENVLMGAARAALQKVRP